MERLNGEKIFSASNLYLGRLLHRKVKFINIALNFPYFSRVKILLNEPYYTLSKIVVGSVMKVFGALIPNTEGALNIALFVQLGSFESHFGIFRLDCFQF